MAGLLIDWASAFLDLRPIEKVAAGFLHPLISSGLSANAALLTLKNAGMGIRRQQGLRLIKGLKAFTQFGSVAKQTASTAYISPEHMPYYPVIHGKNYAYVLQISGVNVDTGESETRFITVTTDNLMTPQQLSDSAYAIAEGNYLEEGFQFETMDIVTGYRDYTLLG